MPPPVHRSLQRPRARPPLALALVAVVALGLASRSPAGSIASLGKYPGDALWALAVFVGLAFVRPGASRGSLAAAAFTVACLVELSQLYHAPWIDAVRSTWLGRMALGSVFHWPDLLAYAVGVALGMLLDRVATGRDAATRSREGSPG